MSGGSFVSIGFLLGLVSLIGWVGLEGLVVLVSLVGLYIHNIKPKLSAKHVFTVRE